jgi:hypothetical protein
LTVLFPVALACLPTFRRTPTDARLERVATGLLPHKAAPVPWQEAVTNLDAKEAWQVTKPGVPFLTTWTHAVVRRGSGRPYSIYITQCDGRPSHNKLPAETEFDFQTLLVAYVE